MSMHECASSRQVYEKCGVFGVKNIGNNSDLFASNATYFGLYALQHRGQDGSGIVSTEKGEVCSHKGLGLVSAVYTEEAINRLKGNAAIGHNRYPTSEGNSPDHVQPILREKTVYQLVGKQPYRQEKFLALGHNGNLSSPDALKVFLENHHVDITRHNDSEMMADAIWYHMQQGLEVEEAIEEAYPLFCGAFACVALTNDKMVAFQDSCGMRPLSQGRLNGAVIFSSETCALDTVQASYQDDHDIKPGEMVVVDGDGTHTKQIIPGKRKFDVFEYIYFSRPDSFLLGKSVQQVRHDLGAQLCREADVDADIVVGVPDSATPAAIGYAEEMGVLYREGFVKNRYIHRTFIQPTFKDRKQAHVLKLNPLRGNLANKRVILVDDSIVRGETLERLVDVVRGAGAKEVHVAITSPPYLYPSFYGVNTPEQKDLIAATMKKEQIQKRIGADSLHYLSLDGMVEAVGLPAEQLCMSNFDGVYPIDIGENRKNIQRVDFQ